MTDENIVEAPQPVVDVANVGDWNKLLESATTDPEGFWEAEAQKLEWTKP